MAVIRFEQFNGIVPRTHPTLLPDGCAVRAHNCKLKNGKLVPLREPKVASGLMVNYENGLSEIKDAKTLYLWHKLDAQNEFIAWPTDDMDVAGGNIAEDESSRLFVTGSTGVGDNGTDPIVLLKYTTANSIIRVPLVKEQLDKPLAVLANGGNADTNNTRYTYFFQTWVDQYGYESGVSEVGTLWSVSYRKVVADGTTTWYDASGTVLSSEPSLTDLEECGYYPSGNGTATVYGVETGYNDGDAITIQPCAAAPSEAVLRRIYKVVTGTETDNIQYIGEGDVYSALRIDLKDEDAGETIPAIESPPDTMRGIHFVPGGFYVAHRTDKPKTVMFSDVSIPTSWPEAYQYDVRDHVVALAVMGNTIVVLTDGIPYAFTGTAPESMSSQALSTPAACVSVKSVCVGGGSVYFASNTGIFIVRSDYYSGIVVQNLTEKFWTKDQWQELNPASCVMGYHDGAIHAFFTKTDGTGIGHTINLNDGAAAITTHDENTQCLCVDDTTDDLYFVRRGE